MVISIDWRDDTTTGREIRYLREAMENTECALRFAAGQAQQYGADPERVIWAGYSAGAWIGSMISFGEGDLAAEWDAYAAANDGPAQRVACTEDADAAQIVAFVPSAGAFPGDFWLGNGKNDGWTAVLEAVQNYTAIGHNPDLKVRLFHGKWDFTSDTNFDAAEVFAGALQEAGYDVVFFPQPGAHESFQTEAIKEIEALYGG